MSARARTGPTMLSTILRGVRARALLSVGSVLLTALAIGSAVLGPIFQVAATSSYLVTRLNEAPNVLTGLTWVFQPDQQVTPGEALRAGVDAADGVRGPFAAGGGRLETEQYDVFDGIGHLVAAVDACAHLELDGACPTAPDEIALLVGDARRNSVAIGDTVEMAEPFGELKVVGTYRVPEEEIDFWFDLQRFASVPRSVNEKTGVVTPYQPAPFVTVPETFDDLPPATWQVRVDRRFDAPPDLTLTDLDQAVAVADDVRKGAPVDAEGGRLTGEAGVNDLAAIAGETRAQQDTARSSIAPALVSLVLVAMALLLRLLMAATDLRLPELALASLRGLSRRQMWSLGLSEPLMLLAFALPAGGVLGVLMALGLVRWWLVPGLPLPLPATAVLMGALVAVAAVLVAVLAVHLVLRVSLSEQLTGVRRPRSSGRLALILQLSLVAVALAVLVSKLTAGAPGQPDVTDLVLPVLLAVVAGLAATRATAWLATHWTRRRRRTRSLPAFVAARAISRRQEGTLVILPVTAAIAIGVFGIGVHASAGAWRESVAATTAPADEMWRSPLTLGQTVALTEELDPEGEHLMAASTMSTLGPTYAILDTRRLERVGAWQDQWTPGSSAAEVAEAIGLRAEVPVVTGRRIGVTVRNQARTDGDLHVRLRLDVVGDRPHFAFLGPFPRGETTTLEDRVPFCRVGCRLDGVTLGGPAALPLAITGDVTFGGFTVDGEPLPGGVDGAGWGRAPEATAGDAIRGVETEGGDVTVSTSSGEDRVIVQLTSGALPERLPVVRGVEAPSGANKDSFGESTSPTEFPTDPVLRGGSTPLLGPQGVLIDFSVITAGREVYQQEVPVYVLLRADTPASVREALSERGLSVETTLAGVKRTLDQGAYALALRLYAVVALLVLVMALAGLFVSTAVQLPSRRRDAASLRVVGVPRRSVMSAVVRELAVVLGGTAVAGLAAGTLAQYVVLRTVTLGVVDDVRTPPLVAAVDWQRLVLLAAAAGLLFGLVALASAAMTVRGARGATLRESAR